MPRKETDCSKYVMYKLCCLDPNIPDEYVGSTTNFKNRKSHHKSNCNNPNSKEYNYKVYQIIRQYGGWSNWSMIQIEEYPCNSKREAEAREEYWRKKIKTTLNDKKCFTTEEEKKNYYEKNREQIREQRKEHYENNKEQLLEKQKEYNEKKKEQIREQRKEHYENNKEQNREKKKKYYENNKEQILEKMREKRRLINLGINN
jgi:hypothetical protein